MSSSNSTNLSVLISHGSTLAALLRKNKERKGNQKNGDSMIADIDPDKIVNDIRQLLEEFGEVQQSLEDKGLSNVMLKIGSIFKELMKNDHTRENPYGKIVDEIEKRVNNLTIPPKQSSAATVAAAATPAAFTAVIQREEDDDIDLEAAYQNLNETEKKCLRFCLAFFSTFDTYVEINKRELIHWWIGMELINELSQGEEVLRKLVNERIFLSPIKDDGTPLHKRYTMNSNTKVQQAAKQLPEEYEAKQTDRLFVACKRPGVLKADTIIAAINTSAYTLNAKIFDWLFEMTSTKVVHLGSWHQGMDYVVVEDMIIKILSSLKKLKCVRFLSLQGISRLQELPSSVYSLTQLTVLDLRACQDLRALPKGIKTLKMLTHLDLSQCYELHYIPREITLLPELRVLKGFVIDPADTDHRAQAILRKYTRSSSCPFTELSKMKQLEKLTIRTRMKNFPTGKDVEALCEMEGLKNLKITWVNSSTSTSNPEAKRKGYDIQRFPKTLQKLELQAAPEATASRLLSLIANRGDNTLEKLYIRGGGFWKLDSQKYCFPNVKVVRFRYLPELHLNWDEFKPSFPKLMRLEMFECPNLIFFPSDEYGVWEES